MAFHKRGSVDRLGFNGLIQHSFALRNEADSRPYHGSDTRERIAERFSLLSDGGAEFCVTSVGDLADWKKNDELTPHSLLVEDELTTVRPQGIALLECDSKKNYKRELPKAFSWAETEPGPSGNESKKRFIFADAGAGGSLSLNDFIVAEAKPRASDSEARSVTQALGQMIAHQRSLLFGFALANRFVNVMLPHAILTPVCEDGESGSWILQPLVSLIGVTHHGGDPFRRMYSLTLFLIPVEGSACDAREMPEGEIDGAINAGWGLARSPWPARLPPFDVDGPLTDYISRLAPCNLPDLLDPGEFTRRGRASASSGKPPPLTLRQSTEAIAFAVALGMAWGPGALIERSVTDRIGNDIVTSLGSARVSSVMVVDPNLTKAKLSKSKSDAAAPGALEALIKTLAKDARVPSSWSADECEKYRLDRAFLDPTTYAVGVLSTRRCLVTTSAGDTQRWRDESGLKQAGWLAYMAIGAATAAGTIRAIDRDLENLGDAEPKAVADLDSQVVVNLHEIYDLDITWESYRHLYRLLRERLGITDDYKALQNKIQALYRATTARYEARAQAWLIRLTAAIVVLSILIVIGTAVVAMK